MEFSLGYFPLQCDLCGQELVNMGCTRCSPPEQSTANPSTKGARPKHLARNSGGFPKFGQLSPAPSTPPPTPRKRVSPYRLSALIRRVEFRGLDGMLLSVSDGTGDQVVLVKDGHYQPFARHVRDKETFTVLTKFKWKSHRWETLDVPYDRGTTDTALFKRICIHFLRFLDTMKKCGDSETCLCGGSRSSAQEVRILRYKLFDLNESFVIKVKACPL